MINKYIYITGPLGVIKYLLKSINLINLNNKLFLKKNYLNTFKKIFKDLLISVTIGWFIIFKLNGIGYKIFQLKIN